MSEVTGSLALKAALDHPAWYLLVAAAYAGAFLLLGRVLRSGMPLGVAYGLWAALGVALTALGAAAVFGEALTPTMLAGIGLVMAGVLLVELGRQRALERS